MAEPQPRWRQLFDAVEQNLTPQVEQWVQSEQFADLTAAMTKLRAQMQERTERAMRRSWHFWNLPAGSDVKRMSEQLASLERRIRDLSKQLEDAKATQTNQRNQGETDGGSKRTQPNRSRGAASA
jgi:phage shock protein A